MPYNVYTQKADGSNRVMYFRYLYDKVGNITNINDYGGNGGHRAMNYDALNRLIAANGSWGTGSFIYDPLGNIRQKKLGSRTVNINYNTLNRVSNVNDAGVSKNYYYDARGNVTNNGERTFTYDQSNQPTVMSGAGTYQYDGNYKRVKAVVTQNGQTKTTYSIYSLGGQLLYTDKVTENEKTDYIRAAGQTIAQIKNSTVKYMHNDLLGSPVRSTYANSNVSFSEEYTPFGEKRLNPDENKDNVGFTGHVQDDATGLTYMQARYYDPAIGRFLSIDPVGFSAGKPMMFNRYAYANNNPYLYTDPNGQFGLLVKAIKVAFKGGDIASTFAGAAQDLNTVFSTSSTAGTGERLMALASLATEVVSPVSARDAKIAKNALGKKPTNVTDQKGIVSDSATVCRGGQCKADNFTNGSGVITDPKTGKLSNVSVGVGNNVDEAAKGIPHKKVGATTAGDVRKAGGDVVNDRPGHHALSGVTAEEAEKIFEEVVENPYN